MCGFLERDLRVADRRLSLSAKVLVADQLSPEFLEGEGLQVVLSSSWVEAVGGDHHIAQRTAQLQAGRAEQQQAALEIVTDDLDLRAAE